MFCLFKGCILPSTDMSSVVVPSANANQSNTNQQQSSSLPTIVITDTTAEKHQPSSESASHDNDSETTNYNHAGSFNENSNAARATQNSNQGSSSNSQAPANPLDALKYLKRRPEINETVFRINKGCKTFDFSFEKNLLITGGTQFKNTSLHSNMNFLFLIYSILIQGLDRTIRLFNPYVPNKPIATLRSHTTPIFYIHLCHIDNRIFSMSTDKCLNVTEPTLNLRKKVKHKELVFIFLRSGI